jgi:hypothetical protein
VKPRQHPITIGKAPRDAKDLRQRVLDMGLEIRQGSKHEKVMGTDGKVIAILSMGSKSGNWRAPLNAWLQIQRWWRENPDQAEILMQAWVEKYSGRGSDTVARQDLVDADYGYRQVDQAKANERATRKADHFPPMADPQYRGRRLYTRSTHRVCDRCFMEVNGNGRPALRLSAGRCCRCGEGTTSGTFVRAPQKDWGCDHSDEL